MTRRRELDLEGAARLLRRLRHVTRGTQVSFVLIIACVMMLAGQPGWSSSALGVIEHDVLNLPGMYIALDAPPPTFDPSLVVAGLVTLVMLHVFAFFIFLAWIARARDVVPALGRSATWVARRSGIDRFVPTREMLLAIDRAAGPNDVPLPATPLQRTAERSYREPIPSEVDARFPRWASTSDWIATWLWTSRLTFLASPFLLFAASNAHFLVGETSSAEHLRRTSFLPLLLAVMLFGMVMTALISLVVVGRILLRMTARLERLKARAAATT